MIRDDKKAKWTTRDTERARWAADRALITASQADAELRELRRPADWRRELRDLWHDMNRGIVKDAKTLRADRIADLEGERAYAVQALEVAECELAHPHVFRPGIRGFERCEVAYSEGEHASLMEQQVRAPVRVLKHDRAWWQYRDAVYVIDGDVEPEDVLALLIERDERRHRRLRRARSVMALRDDAGTSARRHAVPPEVRAAVWERDMARCVECGSRRDLEFDHVIPLALGGSSTHRNLQLLCADCNRSKGATLG